MPRARRAALVTAGLVLVAIDSLSPAVHDSSALWAATTSPGTNVLGGGSFSVPVAPSVSRVARGVNIALSWPAVSFSSGTEVSYLVTRIQADGSRVAVCTGADLPVFSGTSMTCTDKRPPAGSLYTEQPVLSVGGQVTWSLPPSTPA